MKKTTVITDRKRLKKKNAAFSLIELMVVMAIIATLAATAVIKYTSYMSDAKDTTAKVNILAVSSAKELYFYSPSRTASEQATFNSTSTPNASRFALISQFLSISGTSPSTTAAIAVGTAGTDCIIGNMNEAPIIQ